MHGLLLLGFALDDLELIELLLANDSFLFEFNLTLISLHFLRSFQLLMMFFFIEKFPRLLLLTLSHFDSLIRQILLLLNGIEKFVSVELLQLR